MNKIPLHKKVISHLKQHAAKYGAGAVIGASGLTGATQLPPVQQAVQAVTQAPATCHINGMLPDQACTPGAVNGLITQANIDQNICNPNWSTRSERPPVSYTTPLKKQQISEYGYSDTNPGDYEEDHLISLELGGSPTDPQNLWPQPHRGTPLAGQYGSQDKDLVENATHDAICSGKLTLAEAQQEIATDWVSLGLKLGILH